MNTLKNITKVHAKYYANELTLKKSYGSDEKISESLFDSVLHINPHQIDAALFAFKSPLSKGVILADEVGLGKTIEAGLIMSQLWAEGKRKQIVVCPSSLRKQWSIELKEKFNIDSIILEKKEFDKKKNEGIKTLFSENKVFIISYHFASKIYKEIRNYYFDLVVIDEAHKLRNVYKKQNVMANNIKNAFEGNKKLLLTATPLQNNLLELYGLSTLISNHIFGDEKSFKQQYIKDSNLEDLKERIQYFCKRTLRRDVLEYVKYTERKAILKEFEPSNVEEQLYQGVSELLLRDDSYSIPKSQKKLTTLMIRKLLASSSFAVTKTLTTIKSRLLSLYNDEFLDLDLDLDEIFDEDQNALSNEIQEESDDFTNDSLYNVKLNKDKLLGEIQELDRLIELSSSIKTDAKSKSLLEALKIGFEELEKIGANKKALIFTESRRTQEYLKIFLEANGFKDKICVFNGTNNEKESNEIYKNWLEKNQKSGKISNSKTADKRNSIIEYFKNKAEIMIATESAAEGVNLQFCSLVINYDMPWNPQRIEQRIGRCHRYGQKNDVVVINFVNKNNYADQRVYSLLKEKFKLFDGVFGTSDEILGSLESGVDFEKEILSIYQSCRTKEEIDFAFKKLQKSMEKEISESMNRVEKEIFTNFDLSVQDKLMINLEGYLDKFGRMFWNLTKYELHNKAIFYDDKKEFELLKEYDGYYKFGLYQLVDKVKNEDDYNGNIYRTSHPLGQKIIKNNINTVIPNGKLTINISDYTGAKLVNLEKIKGHKGVLMCSRLKLESFDIEEEIIFLGKDEIFGKINQDVIKTFFECDGYFDEMISVSKEDISMLENEINNIISDKIESAKYRNLEFIKEEEIKLYRWSQDKIITVENELDNIKNKIREKQNEVLNIENIDLKVKLNEEIVQLNKKKRNLREELDTNEEKIESMRFNLIKEIKEKSLIKKYRKDLFIIAWEVI